MFQPIEGNTPVYKKVMFQIQNMILSGELKKGDRLPAERQLAEMLHVGRSALKQALSALEALGVIQSRHGDGNYITADSMEVFNPLAIRFYLDRGKEDDILEFRYILEVQLASLAAVKITAEQAESFSALVEEMKTASTVEERSRYNYLFHYRIVDICDNLLIKSIYESIMSLIADQIKTTDGVNFYESHKQIFDAVKSGKPNEAAFYTAEHFKRKFPNYQYYDRLRKSIWQEQARTKPAE